MRPSIDRRTMLRGAAVALALPYLESLLPRARAAAADGETPRRLCVVYVPNGMRREAWNPADGRLLEPFAAMRDELLLLRGLAQDAARAHADGPGDHARACAAFLTGVHPLKSEGQVLVGVSADQLASAALGSRTRLRSLQLGCEGGMNSGQCDSGYACAYSSHLSWAAPRTPAGKEHDPRAVFERLFLDQGDPAFGETREQRARRRKSVLDWVREDARRLERRLGTEDRHKLGEYQAGVRELERRIEALLEPGGAGPGTLPPQPAGIPADYAEHVRVMYELAALAFQTDATRVTTFLVANEGSNRSYPFLEVPEGHHELSHHGGEAAKLDKWERICRFHVEQFAVFVARLRALREGEASVLDRSLVVFGSGIGDGNRHNHDDLPLLLAGGRALGVKSARELVFERETSLNRLHLALLAKLGAPQARFGDASEPLELG